MQQKCLASCIRGFCFPGSREMADLSGAAFQDNTIFFVTVIFPWRLPTRKVRLISSKEVKTLK